MLILLLKATQLDLFDTPTYVHAHTRKDGTSVTAHIARRKKRITPAKTPPKHHAEAKPSKLDGFIAKHGGADHLRETLMAMTAEQRAKLIDAMAHMEDIEPRAVISKLGMHEDAPAKASEPVHVEPAKNMVEEHKHLVEVLESPSHEDDKAEAKKQAAELKEYEAEAAGKEPEVAKDEPKEGDTKTEDGVEYVLRDGRWHRATPDEPAAEEKPAAEEAAAPEAAAASDPEVEAIEDREDLADAMARDPHSDETKTLLKKVAAREAPPPAPEKPAAEAPGDDLDPSSPNYRYRDTGYVAGSRKEMAATFIRQKARSGETVRVTDIDWEELEQNPREAKELITKENLFGAIGWEALREAGMDPGAGFLVSKVYAAVSTKPADDTPDGRHDYSLAITTLRDRMEACRTPGDVVKLLEEMRDERDGVLLNERERDLYERAMTFYRERSEKVRAIDAEYDAIYKQQQKISIELSKHRTEIDKRKRRGWKVDPAAEELVAGLEKEFAAAQAASTKFRADNGMNAVHHQTKTDRGVSTRFEYPYKAEMEQARGALAMVKEMAKARNARENPMTRAWKSLGESFNAVLDYRGYKGSEAFAKHVATVKAGRVSSWDWAEKKSEPRGATKRSTAFQLHVADNVARTGGRPVSVDSTEALKQAFNLREVQSGNWVLDDPNSAKFHVEACAGAFADLADLLGIDDGKVSFKGRLAMAFGARGKGGAKAHYEPVHRVINITKMAGAGSLAHEWFHCVDNLVKEAMTGLPSDAEDFATESPGIVDNPELQAAFRELADAMLKGPHRRMETFSYTEAEERWADHNMAYGMAGGIRGAIKSAKSVQEAVDAVEDAYRRGSFGAPDKRKTKTTRDNWRKIALIHHGKNDKRVVEYASGPGTSMFLIDSTELDQGVSGKYWSQPKEMAARAFSSYIEDKLRDAGRVNTYLVADANNAAYAASPFRPFADRDERARMNAAFDKLFDIIRREDVLAKAASLFAGREAALS